MTDIAVKVVIKAVRRQLADFSSKMVKSAEEGSFAAVGIQVEVEEEDS